VRERRKRKETTKFSCLLSPNLVISYYIYQIRHLIIISALQKKGQIEIDCVSSKSTPIQTREMPDQFPTIHKTTEHPLTKRKKKYPKRWCFLSNKTKKNPFFPHLKQKKLIKTKISLTNRTKKTLCIILFLWVCLSNLQSAPEENERLTVTLFSISSEENEEQEKWSSREKKHDLEYVY